MKENLPKSLQLIFGHEGGYSDDPNDPGNWTSGRVNFGRLKGTKFGIAANTYGHLNIKELTLEDAARIYERDYAAHIQFDFLPSGVDHAMLDFAINSGPSRAIKYLQRIVGVPDDGIIGPITRAEIREVPPREIINDLCDARLRFLKSLRTWGRYGRGWNSRVERVRDEALEMAT